MSLSPRRARGLLKAMAGRRVLVLGDVMLDQFLWGTVSRISPEAPVPVVQITSQSFHLGGAANVATNVRSLGGEAIVVGVVGRDAEAEQVRAELRKAGIAEALAIDARRPTTLKTRIIAHHQQIVRADRELADDVPAGVEDAIVARLRDALPGCGAVVLSDYQKGVVTPRVMRALTGAARRARVPVLVDPKVRRFALYRGVALVTPNQLEAEQASGVRIRTDEDLREAGQKILRLLRCGATLITRGEHGMTLFEKDRKPVHLPTAAREVFDVTGAGDTVIATLGLAQAAGAPLVDAARLANHAAGIVVGKLGTATATPDEILSALDATRG